MNSSNDGRERDFKRGEEPVVARVQTNVNIRQDGEYSHGSRSKRQKSGDGMEKEKKSRSSAWEKGFIQVYHHALSSEAYLNLVPYTPCPVMGNRFCTCVAAESAQACGQVCALSTVHHDQPSVPPSREVGFCAADWPRARRTQDRGDG